MKHSAGWRARPHVNSPSEHFLRLLPFFASFLLLGLTTLALTGAAATQTTAGVQARQFTLYVREGTLPMPDGAQVYVWGFTDDPNGPPKIPGPPIVVNEGDSVEITLVNDLDPTASGRLPTGEGHTIHLHGLDTTMEHDGVPETYGPGLVRQGDRHTYKFTASHAGTYFYHCHQNNVEHQQMGMYGSIVVNAAGGARTAYTGGPAFDREYTLVLSDMDLAGHEQAKRSAKEGAEPYNWLGYEPKYFFVNQMATVGPQGGETQLPAGSGERVLTRVVNAGYSARLVHTHSQPFQIVATDGRPWVNGPTTDTLWLAPGEKYDLLTVAGSGAGITLHTHDGERFRGPTSVAKQPGPAVADNPVVQTYTLYVRSGQKTMPDGAVIPTIGFSDARTGTAAVPGPLFTLKAGDVVDVTLVNDDEPAGAAHAFRVNGLDAPTEGPELVRPGETGSYRFRVPRAGTYWYADPTDVTSQQMGMYGAIVVAPADGSDTAFAGGPAFDQQYTMVLSELDSAMQGSVRQALDEGRPTSRDSRFTPNYFLINGLAYPDTEASASTTIRGKLGDRILIRTVNAGQIPHAMHLHGYHFMVLASNGNVISNATLKDTVLLAPGETFDLLFVADQDGMFPFHDHFETANTNNGVWLGGMHTMVAIGGDHADASPAARPATVSAAEGPTVFVRDNFYTPNQLTVPVGTTVQWEHQGRTEHSVTSLQAYFDSGTLRGGDTFSFTFSAPGRYDYFCRFHITNRGVIIVQ